jgi:hypothetical protein
MYIFFKACCNPLSLDGLLPARLKNVSREASALANTITSSQLENNIKMYQLTVHIMVVASHANPTILPLFLGIPTSDKLTEAFLSLDKRLVEVNVPILLTLAYS